MSRSESSNRPAEVVGDPARRVRRVRAALERDDLEVGVAAPRGAGRAHPRRVASDDRQPPCHRCADATRLRETRHRALPDRPDAWRRADSVPCHGCAPEFGHTLDRVWEARRLTSLADTPWMTEAVDALARELRLHHAPTADHSHRLATLARHVAERLGLGPLEATEVELVAVLHDVGKLTIDPAPARLGGPARRGPARADPPPHHRRRGAPHRDRRARAPREPRPRHPRGVGRDRLPRRPARRADPAHGAHRLRRRLVRRDDERPRLPHRAAAPRGVPAAAQRRRRAVRPARGRRAAARRRLRAAAALVDSDHVPELPEVEITARRLDAALRGATIESALAPGINALKTFDPPLHALDGATIEGVRRRGKHARRRHRRRPRRCSCTSCPPGGCSSTTSARRCATARRACSSDRADRRRAASCACASSGRSRPRG